MTMGPFFGIVIRPEDDIEEAFNALGRVLDAAGFKCAGGLPTSQCQHVEPEVDCPKEGCPELASTDE